MQIRDAIQKEKGFAYMMEQLNTASGFARRVLLSKSFETDMEALKAEWDIMEKVIDYWKANPKSPILSRLRHQLGKVKDLGGSFLSLTRGRWLDDVELFELKTFAMNADLIAELWAETRLGIITYPSFEKVIDILDPEKTRVATFYIYNKYSEKLTEWREKLKISQQKLSEWREKDPESMALKEEEQYFETLSREIIQEEDRIRANIATRLTPFVKGLYTALEQLVYLDILLAKCEQAITKELTKPHIVENRIAIRQIFHPLVKDSLQEQGKRYQPIDLNIIKQPNVITGANMAGKTVLLKTMVTLQYLAQFGFFVPAEHAEIMLFEEVLVSIGDEQSEESGLSSFAAEMVTLNEILSKIEEGASVLVLIDELARTTNPIEGTALVNAVVEMLNQHEVCSLITTHYNGIVAPCVRWRVKGFLENKVIGALTTRNINDYIDYSLEPDDSHVVPMEALNIAGLLGINSLLLEKAYRYLHAEKGEKKEE